MTSKIFNYYSLYCENKFNELRSLVTIVNVRWISIWDSYISLQHTYNNLFLSLSLSLIKSFNIIYHMWQSAKRFHAFAMIGVHLVKYTIKTIIIKIRMNTKWKKNYSQDLSLDFLFHHYHHTSFLSKWIEHFIFHLFICDLL